MLKWSNTKNTPLNGWRYYQEETDTMIRGPHWPGLLQKVAEHRAANNLPIEPGFEHEIELYMCSLFPGKCVEKPNAEVPRISMGQVIQFTRILGDALLNGHTRVEQEEADYRAAICVDCPSNIKPSGCIPCGMGSVVKQLSRFVGARETAHDNKLESCKHCGCLNKAQLWFQLELLQRHTSDRVNSELPDNCWKK